MKQKKYNTIGVMSGTSLDGVDLAYIKIVMEKEVSAKILIAETVPYTSHWKLTLQKAHALSREALLSLNQDYTRYLAKVITDFMQKHSIAHLDAICSHGHTVLHQPESGFTLQIGNLPSLASLVNNKVVCDFRVQDVALGGQGAPLVPIGDHLLFGKYDYCLNLGGFANVSTESGGKRIAYDICAVNTVLNVYAERLGESYDDMGAFAKAGTPNRALLEKLNKLPFFSTFPPKSLGIEWVHKIVFPLIESFELNPNDVLSTFTLHIAVQIKNQFRDGSTVLVTGGGAYNTYLLELMQKDTKVKYILPEKTLIEYKEALIFALLGVLRLEEKINTLSSVTGAECDHSSGIVYLP